MTNRFNAHLKFVDCPPSEEIQNAIRLLKARKESAKRQRLSKFRKHIPTIFALLQGGNSLALTCAALKNLHGFEGSPSALCRFIHAYPLLQEAKVRKGQRLTSNDEGQANV